MAEILHQLIDSLSLICRVLYISGGFLPPTVVPSKETTSNTQSFWLDSLQQLYLP